jgi:ribosome-binding protein aMBF1 (putative translation factor)
MTAMGRKRYEEVITHKNHPSGSDLERFAEASKQHFEALYLEDFGLGEAVAKRRAELSLSQVELAKRTGVRQADISKIERGVANPTLTTMKKIFKVLELQLSAKPYGQVQSTN